ncbi:PRC-barrel domain containing protein [Microbacterium sp. NPDC019599]|uniref:PRC-barrel domain-containing protein n=1 Tax=Microbacterium sp. NPDC019599 TaxID=3154690 RepID=UPI0033D2B2F9
MLLSELLGCRVLAPDGGSLGVVVDVRFRRGPARRSHEGELELIALIVSPHSRQSFYGYERGRVNTPAVINAIVTRLHRASRIIPWECVEAVDRGEVRLGVEAPDIPLDARRPIGEGQA